MSAWILRAVINYFWFLKAQPNSETKYCFCWADVLHSNGLNCWSGPRFLVFFVNIQCLPTVCLVLASRLSIVFE